MRCCRAALAEPADALAAAAVPAALTLACMHLLHASPYARQRTDAAECSAYCLRYE